METSVKHQYERNVITSSVSVRPKADKFCRNQLGVTNLFPVGLSGEYQSIIAFLEEYYKWLNTEVYISSDATNINNKIVSSGAITDSIYRRKDIDEYISIQSDDVKKLFNEFANGFTQKHLAIDFRTLLKNITSLYQQKGTEEGVNSFFIILFNIASRLYYPWDDVLIASAGEWDGTRFTSNKGFLSDNIHLQDSNYWQRFSYDVKVGEHDSQWKTLFEMLLHPSGFKFFSSFILVLFASDIRLNRLQPGLIESVLYESTSTLELLIHLIENGLILIPQHIMTFVDTLYDYYVSVLTNDDLTFDKITFYNPALMNTFDALTFENLDINRSIVSSAYITQEPI